MQHRRMKENVFFRCLCLRGNGSHSRCLPGSQRRRSWLTMQRKGKGVILLFGMGVFLASILPAAAEEDEEEGGRSKSVINVDLQPRHQGNTSRASSFENKHESLLSRRELSEKEKFDLKRTDRDEKKANKPVQIGNKGKRESGATDNPPTRCAQNLRDAINGAISLIAGTRLLVEHLLRLWSSVPYVPMLVCPSSLFPYNPTLPWPKREMLKKGDLLRDVLESGTLNVAGVGGASLSSGQVQFTVARDRGEEGNYNRAEPTGFFPDYLRAIADTIEKQYKTPIRVRWLFYPTVESAQAGVLRGEAHMTDIYFLLAHSTPGEPQPLAHFYSTCPVVGSPVLLIVRESLSHGESDVNDLLSLNRIIDRAKTDSDRQLVFASPELATTVRHCLSPVALITFAEDLDQAAQLVLDGNAVAVVATGVLPRLHPLLRVVSAHILLGKGAWIERTYAVECVEEEHGFDLAAYARERSPRESKRVFEASGKARENNTLAGTQPSAIQHALWILLLSSYVVF